MAGGYDHGVDQEGVRLVLQADPLLRSVVDTADRSGAVLDDPQAGVRLHGLAVRPGEVLAGCGLDGTTVAAGRLRHAGLREAPRYAMGHGPIRRVWARMRWGRGTRRWVQRKAAPELRDHYRDLPDAKLVAALANTRPAQLADAGRADTLFALRSLARRHARFGEEITEIEHRVLARATAANPALLAVKGVGAVIGAQLLITAGDNPDRLHSSASFAALCGTAPIPVSSGRTDRHRLSRGGDPQANAALHHIVKVRLSYDPTTRAYRESHLAKGWTIKAVFRALKRAVAREVFPSLTGQCTVPDYTDPRPARRAKNLTLTAAAAHLGVWPARIGELELGRRPNDQLATAYQDWLNAP